MKDLKQLREKLAKLLPFDRFEHSKRVERVAVVLAQKHKINQEKVRVAALLHDCARYLDRTGMLKEAKKLGLNIDPIAKFEPKLLHAELSAKLAKKLFGVKDKAILQAIASHTVGTEKMSLLDKIIYLADHIEESRNYHGVNKVKKLAFSDLDAAIAESTGAMIQHLLNKGLPIFEGTVKTRNHYLLRSYNG